MPAQHRWALFIPATRWSSRLWPQTVCCDFYIQLHINALNSTTISLKNWNYWGNTPPFDIHPFTDDKGHEHSWIGHGASMRTWMHKACSLVNIRYSIMILMKFADLSQSDCSNWVMWQVKDPCSQPRWDGCLTQENSFDIMCENWIILL